MDFYSVKALLKEKRRIVKMTGEKIPEGVVLNKSIVFEFYIRRNTTFSSLKMNPYST